ncbi:response regulator [Natronomonas salina]|uniref:PAS domain-containing response regulator n=1 Tax=Natronomonas salina TaxID=1710540 RepID=UPI0015B57F49|nr:response regulator [Natronomonas salina]QLD87503.1 response regulator [Natronomonas salina]
MTEKGSPRADASALARSIADEVPHVLHVDDDRAFLELAETFLSRHGLIASTAESTTEARERLASSAVDCIVCDYDMPEENGVEFLESVRADRPNLPFVLFTGKGSEEVASEAISAGVTDYLQKETGTEQWRVLANRVENLVERRRSERLAEYSFRAMETAREGISLIDVDGRFVYVNRAYADFVGYDREDLVGRHWEELYQDADLEDVYDEVLPAVRQDGEWEGEHVYLRADGSTIPVDHALSYCEEGVLVCLIRAGG